MPAAGTDIYDSGLVIQRILFLGDRVDVVNLGANSVVQVYLTFQLIPPRG